jgi:hypothetical protein
MATVQQRTSLAPAMMVIYEVTRGQSDTSGLLTGRMNQAYDHLMLLHSSAFSVVSHYSPFLPKRTFEIRPRYRFSGPMPSLEFHLDD